MCSHPCCRVGRRRVGVVPVARHHDVTAAGDLTDRVDTGRRPVRAEHHDVDPGARVPDRAERRVVGVQVVGAPEPRDRHRRLTLAVELDEDRAERRHRLLQAVHVHRAAAVDHRAQVLRSRPSGRHQPRHHGGGEEAAAARMVVAEVEELVRFECRRLRYHLARPTQYVGRDVEAGAVRHRGAVDQAAVLVRVVEVRQVGHRHRHQVAVRQHRTLRPSGGSAGVEQPRQCRRIGRRHGRGVGGQPCGVPGPGDHLDRNVGGGGEFSCDLG